MLMQRQARLYGAFKLQHDDPADEFFRTGKNTQLLVFRALHPRVRHALYSRRAHSISGAVAPGTTITGPTPGSSRHSITVCDDALRWRAELSLNGRTLVRAMPEGWLWASDHPEASVRFSPTAVDCQTVTSID